MSNRTRRILFISASRSGRGFGDHRECASEFGFRWACAVHSFGPWTGRLCWSSPAGPGSGLPQVFPGRVQVGLHLSPEQQASVLAARRQLLERLASVEVERIAILGRLGIEFMQVTVRICCAPGRQRADRQTDGRADGRTEGWTDGMLKSNSHVPCVPGTEKRPSYRCARRKVWFFERVV
jgi:hypothetical protein